MKIIFLMTVALLSTKTFAATHAVLESGDYWPTVDAQSACPIHVETILSKDGSMKTLVVNFLGLCQDTPTTELGCWATGDCTDGVNLISPSSSTEFDLFESSSEEEPAAVHYSKG